MIRSPRVYHLIFAVTILALISLGMWWTVYIVQSVEFERRARLDGLHSLVDSAALIAGHSAEPPRIGPATTDAPLEWVATSSCTADDMWRAALPMYPELAVRASQDAVASVRQKNLRRRVMVVGEGSLLFVLLGVCTIMLYRLVRQERRANARMQDFVSAVTHEMKTPLAGIKSLLQTMAAGKVPEAERGRLIALGLKETDRLEHSIENILLSGSLRTDRYRVRLERVALKGLLSAIVDHRRSTLADRPNALDFEWEPGRDELEITTDPRALRVVLENLIDNALKYGSSDEPIRVRARLEPETVVVSVSDHGIGFNPDRAEELFLPFRGGSVSDQVQHGTGLGLTIARELARRMGGDLTASSPGRDQGSCFALRLPVQAAEETP